MATIVLISCTKSKKDYRCKAMEMYSASPRFQLAYEYATLVADRTFILSAKHGLLAADQLIDPYNETLKDKNSQERREWEARVLDTLGIVSDLTNDDFIIIAGRDYYDNLLLHPKRFWLPLKGKGLFKWVPELERLLTLERANNPPEMLHLLFNGLPRLDWSMIKELPFNNGIYIMFERSQTYKGMDRIVRVGTHRSQGRLKGRLQDHFLKEDADGSIFRKNIGRAILNANSDPYLKIWEIDLSKPGNKKQYAHVIDEKREDELESQVTRYLKENISYICFPVYEKVERLHLEEGIIATLNRDPSFLPNKYWLGNSNPMADISGSGLWNREGLNGRPLTDEELSRIKWLSRFGNDFYMHRTTRSIVKGDNIPETMQKTLPVKERITRNKMGNTGGKYHKLGEYLKGVIDIQVRLSFAEIENILGFNLPASAFKHRPWWGNGGHVQADGWLNAGWRVDSVELGRNIGFVRE